MVSTSGSMIYIKSDEKEKLRKKATELGMSLSELLVAGAFAYPPKIKRDVK